MSETQQLGIINALISQEIKMLQKQIHNEAVRREILFCMSRLEEIRKQILSKCGAHLTISLIYPGELENAKSNQQNVD